MNISGQIGRKYLTDKSYYKYATARTLTDRTKPDFFLSEKEHLGSIPLPQQLPIDLGTLDAWGEKNDPAVNCSQPVRLATLLHYTLGLLRYEVDTPYAYHRASPSPRCLYATEIFLCTFQQAICGVEGVFRYNPVMHHLEIRRKGSGYRQLEVALGRPLSEVEGVLVITADFWRIAYLYDDFAYNLAVLEVGHVIGQLDLLRTRLGWDLEWCECFIDYAVTQLLGLEMQLDAPLAAFVIRDRKRQAHITFPKDKQEQQISSEEVDLNPVCFHRKCSAPLAQCSGLVEMMQASQCHRLSDSTDTWCKSHKSDHPHQLDRSHLPIRSHLKKENEEEIILLQFEAVKSKWKQPDLLTACKSRSSGNDKLGSMILPHALRFSDVAKVLYCLLQTSSKAGQDVLACLSVYVVANRVNGLQTGVYRLHVKKQGLQPIRLGEVRADLQRLSVYPQTQVHIGSFPLILFLTFDANDAFQRFGDRGYSLLQMKVGSLAQRILVLASGMNWMARPLRAFYEGATDHWLGEIGSDAVTAYQIVIGEHQKSFLSFDLSL